MPHALEHLDTLLRRIRAQTLKDQPTPLQRRGLVDFARENQRRTLHVGVLGRLGELDGAAVRDVPLGILRQEQFADEGLLQRCGGGTRRAAGDRVGHAFHARGLDLWDAVVEDIRDGGRWVHGAH